MKIRFEVDEVEAFRRGLDAKKKVVIMNVDPAKLDQTQRNLIADRLKDKAVHRLDVEGDKRKLGERIKVANPTLEGLLEAIQENEKELKDSEQKSLSA